LYICRYVLRFKDAFKQIGVDALQGIVLNEEDFINSSTLTSKASMQVCSNNETSEETLQLQKEREDNIFQLIVDCQKQLVEDNEDCFGKWALINFNE
jgi:hypothetical protein